MQENIRPQTVWEAIQWAVSFLSPRIENPRLDSELILAYLLESDRSRLYAKLLDKIDKETLEEFIKQVHRRGNGVPLQYITGQQEFMSLNFFVNENVLIPRGDTEILVEKAIELLGKIQNPKILDMCTGSGAISLSLAHYLPNSKVIGVDISEGALEVAQINREKLKLSDRVKLMLGNLFEPIDELRTSNSLEQFSLMDMIVSNPPYIPQEDIPNLQREVAEFEPKLALDGGLDGLDFYRKIIPRSYNYLKTNGYLLLEIGMEQGKAVKEIFIETWPDVDTEIIKDFAGHDRVVLGRKL